MLLPYSTSSTRISIFWTLLFVAVLTMPVFVVLVFLRVAPWLGLLCLFSGVAAIPLLCVWCVFYLRDEPGLVRLALIWIALLSLVLTIGIAIMTFTPPTIIDTMEMKVRADIQSIRRMLSSYKEANEYYPSTDQGLRALVPRFTEEVPKDAWGTAYIYRCPGKRDPNTYDLFSAGPDRIADTADDEWGR